MKEQLNGEKWQKELSSEQTVESQSHSDHHLTSDKFLQCCDLISEIKLVLNNFVDAFHTFSACD